MNECDRIMTESLNCYLIQFIQILAVFAAIFAAIRLLVNIDA